MRITTRPRRIVATSVLLVAVASLATTALAETSKEAFQKGVALQQERRTQEAVEAYRRALKRDPFLGPAHYEIGWSYWLLEQWEQVVRHWETAIELGVDTPELPTYLQTARDNLEGKLEPLVRVPIGTRAMARIATVLEDGAGTSGGERPKRLVLELVARFQHYNPRPDNPADRFDRYVFSPKSVRLLPNGDKAYVNALEGLATIVYDPRKLKRRGVIVHRFGPAQAPLFERHPSGEPWSSFPETQIHPNRFSGKPVESALSADGRYLWVPYYRRDFDRYGVLPSAVAVIDTRRDKIVRVLNTGPIPKYVAASRDGNWLAVIHWGDNTVGLIDTSGGDVATFRRQALIVVGRRLQLDEVADTDRDHGCGYCLRGAVFTSDSRYLLVARMGGGGIAVLDVAARKYIGTVHGMRPTPRHLVLSPDGHTLYISSSFAGYVSAYRTVDLMQAVLHKKKILAPLRETHTGAATRTIALSPDGSLLFAAVNKENKIVVLEAASLRSLLTIPADSFPVGMAVSPDGTQLWVTAQGHKRRGGNSVMVYRIEYE